MNAEFVQAINELGKMSTHDLESEKYSRTLGQQMSDKELEQSINELAEYYGYVNQD